MDAFCVSAVLCAYAKLSEIFYSFSVPVVALHTIVYVH